MELAKAIEIIQYLADGVNPYTGEVFGEASVFQNADTARALYVALEELKYRLSRKEKHKDYPGNVGKPWTAEEEASLMEEFDSGVEMAAIAIKHERTNWAIQSRLMKLGKR